MNQEIKPTIVKTSSDISRKYIFIFPISKVFICVAVVTGVILDLEQEVHVFQLVLNDCKLITTKVTNQIMRRTLSQQSVS